MQHPTFGHLRGVVALITLLAAGAALLGVASGATAAPGQGSSPTISVTPSTGLTDGQQVTITGSGFTPNQAIGISMCKDPVSSGDDCDLSTANVANGDGAGSFTMQYTVKDTIFGNHSCVPNGCLLAGSNLNTDNEFSNRVPISFGATTTSSTSGATSTSAGAATTATTASGATTSMAGTASTSSTATPTTLANSGASDQLPWTAGIGGALLAGGGTVLLLRRRRRRTA